MTEAAAGIGPARPTRWVRLALAALIVHLALAMPDHPAALAWRALRLFPLELPVILLGLAALPPGRTATAVVRLAIVALLLASMLLKVASIATVMTLGRAFQPILDLHLLVSGWHLGSGAIGRPLMILAVLAAIAAIAAAAALLAWATRQWAELRLAPPLPAAAAGLSLAAGIVVVAEVGQDLRWWPLPLEPPGAAFTTRLGVQRIIEHREAAADLREFRAAADLDRWNGVEPLLDRLAGSDVLLIFVESYGATSLTNPLYADAHRETLAGIGRDLGAAGLSMRSAWLDAPTFGGQSWLSHATLASGLWIDGQRSYGAYLASPRRSLFHLAQQAGFRTAAVMPAITMDWPEAALMGFDRVLPAAELGYRGQPFNWVTMPDQFTLAAFDRLARDGAEAPLFAQIALVSSHAPWVPIPELVPWGEVGDGTVFDVWAESGDPPEVVWRDQDRVRAQYRLAIDYSLSAVGAYLRRRAADPPLAILIGDHQPARMVSQQETNAVPVHVVGPPDLVARIDEWGWTEGMVPAPAATLWPMSAVRDRFLAAYSSGEPSP